MTALPSNAEGAYDFLIFIGRFQPFHLGHKAVIDRALELSRSVIVLVGSACRPRSLRNPFTWEERSRMILDAYPAEQRGRIVISPLLDTPYSDNDWSDRVRQSVQSVLGQVPRAGDPRVGLIGHNKDNTSYYLQMFPEWASENVAAEPGIHATDVRSAFLRRLAEGPGESFLADTAGRLPATTAEFLTRFAEGIGAADLAEEWRAIDGYRRAWATAPYAPTFVTVDAVVIQNGHILMIRRRFAPGRGRLALPGGFLEPHERLADAVVRELSEETAIDLPATELMGLIKHGRVFDYPNRSDRGRTITHAFLIELPGDGPATVTASDDAAEAFWVRIDDLDPQAMFEDHWDIVQEMLRPSVAEI